MMGNTYVLGESNHVDHGSCLVGGRSLQEPFSNVHLCHARCLWILRCLSSLNPTRAVYICQLRCELDLSYLQFWFGLRESATALLWTPQGKWIAIIAPEEATH